LPRKQRLAVELRVNQGLDYEDVGVPSGNPPGTWPATTSVNLVGLDATVTVQIRF